MTAVFSHGRLRLYLLKLLDDGPKHGYELIRLLEDRFLGLYAPSGRHHLSPAAAAGGRRAGHPHRRRRPQGLRDHRRRPGRAAPARRRAGRRWSPTSTPRWRTCPPWPARSQTEVRGSVRDLKRELREATRQTRRTRLGRRPPAAVPAGAGRPAPGRAGLARPSRASGWPRSPSRSAGWSARPGQLSRRPSCAPRSGCSTARWTGCAACCAEQVRRVQARRLTGIFQETIQRMGAGSGARMMVRMRRLPQTEARLLVVEDDPNILELLSASLRFAGFDVATATNGSATRSTRPRTTAPTWSCST